jgi:hypothetical protein
MEIKNTGYQNALKKVVELRLQRKKLYGDGHLDKKDRFFITMIEEKAIRMF